MATPGFWANDARASAGESGAPNPATPAGSTPWHNSTTTRVVGPVGVGDAVGVAVGVTRRIAVGVGVAVGFGVGLAVAVGVGVASAVPVAIGVSAEGGTC